ncbi:uncharacterized protein LOC108149919 [Drosophila elegans]|uniref:uncharacterized protein LOC108149919 n=1 Tax=Drosophila elegans TaxID=30023 RepID=UPI0007E7A802|nr:uncharacterized protein LOC108149919 [Drosophila elegans]
MFNKSIVVALIVCACYLGTIEARPDITDPLNLAKPLVMGGVAAAVETVPTLVENVNPLKSKPDLPLPLPPLPVPLHL